MVDQLSQAFIWCRHMETLTADSREVGNEVGIYFLEILWYADKYSHTTWWIIAAYLAVTLVKDT